MRHEFRVVVAWRIADLCPRNRVDGKRKASDEPSSPLANKRAKHDESAESDKDKDKEKDEKPVLKRIPFPEKVCGPGK